MRSTSAAFAAPLRRIYVYNIKRRFEYKVNYAPRNSINGKYILCGIFARISAIAIAGIYKPSISGTINQCRRDADKWYNPIHYLFSFFFYIYNKCFCKKYTRMQLIALGFIGGGGGGWNADAIESISRPCLINIDNMVHTFLAYQSTRSQSTTKQSHYSSHREIATLAKLRPSDHPIKLTASAGNIELDGNSRNCCSTAFTSVQSIALVQR